MGKDNYLTWQCPLCKRILGVITHHDHHIYSHDDKMIYGVSPVDKLQNKKIEHILMHIENILEGLKEK